jgi:hypothetical protein
MAAQPPGAGPGGSALESAATRLREAKTPPGQVGDSLRHEGGNHTRPSPLLGGGGARETRRGFSRLSRTQSFAAYAIVERSAASDCRVSIRVCWTTIGTFDSTSIA